MNEGMRDEGPDDRALPQVTSDFTLDQLNDVIVAQGRDEASLHDLIFQNEDVSEFFDTGSVTINIGGRKFELALTIKEVL